MPEKHFSSNFRKENNLATYTVTYVRKVCIPKIRKLWDLLKTFPRNVRTICIHSFLTFQIFWSNEDEECSSFQILIASLVWMGGQRWGSRNRELARRIGRGKVRLTFPRLILLAGVAGARLPLSPLTAILYTNK